MPSPAEQAAHARALTLFERFADHPRDRQRLGESEPPEVLAILARLHAAEQRARKSFPTEDDAALARRALPLPDRIGSYRLAELIGEGGMGLVFAAARDDGLFDHRVAIKLIHPDRFGPAAMRRFDRERRLLARLDHPFIARLIDGGITPDGWPYIVMELIEGMTIDRHAASARLDSRAIGGLLIGAVQALQAAHAGLVIHGDVKPDNILVRLDGTPRLLDFGVSRLADAEVDPGLTGRTAAYAAPEVRRGEPASVASDLYGFGILMRRLLGDGAAQPADARIADRTLEAIAAKATQSDPARRYGNAQQLASDLCNWRDQHPTSARENDPAHVAGLFLRRHWISGLVSGILLVALLLVLGFAVVAWRRAQARIDDVRALTRYQLVDLDRRLDALPHSVALRLHLAVEAQAYLERLALDRDSPDDLRRQAADGFRRLALLQGAMDRPSLADMSAARGSLARALAMLKNSDTRQSAALRGSILIDAARMASGDADSGRAARLLARVDADALGPADRVRYRLTGSEIEQWNGHYGAAIGQARMAARALARLPASTDTALMWISAADLAAEASFYAGAPTTARRLYVRALAMAEDAARRRPGDHRVRWALEKAQWALGTTFVELGDAASAMPLIATAYRSSARAAIADPADSVAARRHRMFMLAYGEALSLEGDHRRGLALIRHSVSLRRRWWHLAPADVGRQRDWTIATMTLGEALMRAGETAAACTALEKARRLVTTMETGHSLSGLDQRRLLLSLEQGAAKNCVAPDRSGTGRALNRASGAQDGASAFHGHLDGAPPHL